MSTRAHLNTSREESWHCSQENVSEVKCGNRTPKLFAYECGRNNRAWIPDLSYESEQAALTADVCQIKDLLPRVRVIEAI